MSSNRGGGWESVVGELDDAEPEEERTPTDLSPPSFAEPAVDRRPLMDLKSGARASVPAPAPALVPAALPRPAAPLTLPKPRGGASGPAAPATAKLPKLAEGFADGLMERLGPEASPPPPKTSFFVEYKELVRSIAIALLLIVGFIAYKLLSADEPEAIATPVNQARTPGKLDAPPKPTKKLPDDAKANRAPGPGKEATSPPEETPEETAPAPKAPALPILSIMTIPPEAIVEVNGFVRGTSPIVTTSPNGSAPIRIKITKSRYKTWEETVTPNETGHFVVKVVLEER